MRRKVDGPALLVAPMTSLDDAIRLVNGTATTSSPVGKPANLASYVFAQPATAKYLSQFIDAQASFVNHIPAQLLGESKIQNYHSYNQHDCLTLLQMQSALPHPSA